MKYEMHYIDKNNMIQKEGFNKKIDYRTFALTNGIRLYVVLNQQNIDVEYQFSSNDDEEIKNTLKLINHIEKVVKL